MIRPHQPLPPGATIGILGDGQLGRMLALAAASLGYRCHAFGPEPGGPAAQVCATHTAAAFDDQAALDRFARSIAVATVEWENVPVPAAERVAAMVPLHPGAGVLAAAQDRLLEKQAVAQLGAATAPFHAVDSAAALATALEAMGGRGILKTRRMGYDGKGQLRLEPGSDAAAAWAALGGVPAILEGIVPFDRELSVLICRAQDGQHVAYGPILNVHRDGILRRSDFPVALADGVAEAAVDMGVRIAGALGAVGVLAIELFQVGDRLLFNEMAPRVHNSGHGTIEGCVASQFANHIRAVAGLPLADSQPIGSTRMENLIGADLDKLPDLWADPAARVHLYGKADVRPGRKMGHVTWLTPFSRD